MKIAAIILAAGKGTRMGSGEGSEIPKVMYELSGKPMIDYAIANVKKTGIEDIILIVGYKKELIQNHLKDSVKYAVQEELLGTGHAVMMARELVEGKCDGILVCCGDAPLFKQKTIKKLIDIFENPPVGGKPAIAMLSTHFSDPTGYGRIMRDSEGEVIEIIEQKDCTPEQVKINEGNPGFYIFDNEWFWQNVDKLKSNNSQHEYYLTDMIMLAKNQGKRIVAIPTEDETEAMGVNTQEQLKQAEKKLQSMKHDDHKKRLGAKITKTMNIGLVHEKDRILLAMKKRGYGVGLWNGYGGKVKPGETVEEALIREMKEESGIDVKKHTKRGELIFETLGDEEAHVVHLYHILDYEGEPQESEEMLPKWFGVNEIPFDSMWPDDTHWMPLFLAGKKFEGWFLFDENNLLIDHILVEE